MTRAQSLLASSIFAALVWHSAAASFAGCPPEGPLLPRPQRLHESEILKNATSKLEGILDQALEGSIKSGWSIENTSFSLGLVSMDSPNGLPLWEYHHRGSANVNGTGKVEGDTQYLVGSLSKLISDMMVLRTGIDLNMPVTQYIPELANETSLIDWQNISLAVLSDHLSGIPPNYGFSEFYFLNPLLQQLGLPELAPEDYGDCGILGLNSACTKEQTIQGMLTARPVTAPYQRPAYSTLAFTLISYALTAEFNKTYEELLDEYIVRPFNLTNTGVSPGNTSRAVIPPVENSWGSDYGDNAPGGGLYSSTHDLSILMHAILDKSALHTETEVREWLKPHSSTSSLYNLVGRPWEIYRSSNLTPAHPHTIDIYGKNGGAYGYISQMAVIDQYGIGLSILTAGPQEAWRILYDAMLGVVLPSVEEETRVQAEIYVGNFSSVDGLVQLSTSIDDGPGVVLNGLSRNGSDLLGALEQVFGQALPQFGKLSPNFRMFPAEFSQAGTTDRNGTYVDVIREDWRINLDFLPNTKESSGSDLPGQGAVEQTCVGWQTADWFYYGGQAVDRIVAVRGLNGELVGFEVPYLRAELQRERNP